MSKYSSEFELKVEKYCIEEQLGFKEAVKHFNIPTKENVKEEARRCQEHGIEKLIKNPKTSLYW